MKLTNILSFFQRNPFYLILLIIFILLTIYQEVLKERAKHPENKEKKRTPNLSVASPDKATGIIFGKSGKKVYYSKATDEGHVFVCAASGAGKTTAIAIPSIRSFCKKTPGNESNNTCFVIDISGDIEPNCDIPNKLVWDVEDPKSIPYNILAPIDSEKDPQKQNELLQKLAFIVMPDCVPEGSTTKWFTDSGRNILTGALIHYYHQGLDFVDICRKIKSLSVFELFHVITSAENEDAILYIAQFDGENEKNTAGCKHSLDDAITIFATHSIMRNIIRRPIGNEPSLTPSLLETHNLFFKIPDADTDIYGPILGIITAQTFNYCAKRKNYQQPHILFVLDEYSSLHLDKTEALNCARKYRKKSIRLMILTQGLTDLDILYGKDIREAILGNIKFKVILGITDPKSQQYFSDIIGMKDYRTKSTSVSGKSKQTTYSVRQGYRIPPEQFGQLTDSLYLIMDDGNFLKLKKNFYFKK